MLKISLKIDQYPLTRVDEVFNELRNSKVFTVINLSDAYLQLNVSDSSHSLLTINTHNIFYLYNTGILCRSVVSAIFQATMEIFYQIIPMYKYI